MNGIIELFNAFEGVQIQSFAELMDGIIIGELLFQLWAITNAGIQVGSSVKKHFSQIIG
jgi:hypothetical protein